MKELVFAIISGLVALTIFWLFWFEISRVLLGLNAWPLYTLPSILSACLIAMFVVGLRRELKLYQRGAP